jgi:hypothetical protein
VLQGYPPEVTTELLRFSQRPPAQALAEKLKQLTFDPALLLGQIIEQLALPNRMEQSGQTCVTEALAWWMIRHQPAAYVRLLGALLTEGKAQLGDKAAAVDLDNVRRTPTEDVAGAIFQDTLTDFAVPFLSYNARQGSHTLLGVPLAAGVSESRSAKLFEAATGVRTSWADADAYLKRLKAGGPGFLAGVDWGTRFAWHMVAVTEIREGRVYFFNPNHDLLQPSTEQGTSFSKAFNSFIKTRLPASQSLREEPDGLQSMSLEDFATRLKGGLVVD